MTHGSLRWLPVVVGLFMASACDGPDSGCDCINAYNAIAASNNISSHKYPSDTTGKASFTVVWNGQTLANARYSFTYALDVAPGHGATVNLIRILQGTVTKGTLCSAAPCAASGMVTGVTDTTLFRTLRNVEATIRVYTDTDPDGAMSGAIFPQ